MQWLNEPQQWAANDNVLTITPETKSDFWRTTHYGFIFDSGHFYYQVAENNFSCSVRVRANYQNQYDQAGLMVRLDEYNWLKCGIEYVDGVYHVSAVLTLEHSDWSVVKLAEAPEELWLTVTRNGDTLQVLYATEAAATPTMVRLGYFPPALPVQVGLMAAAPIQTGFSAEFRDFQLEALPQE